MIQVVSNSPMEFSRVYLEKLTCDNNNKRQCYVPSNVFTVWSVVGPNRLGLLSVRFFHLLPFFDGVV